MSNETKKPETTVDFDEVSARFERTRGASLQTLEQLAAENQGELYAKGDLDEAAKEHARCKAEADQLREKAEVEAFGHRFHAKLLAAMKAGDHNVLHVLGAAMEAERHPSGPFIARTISEARMNVSCAQRQVKTLLEYTIPRPDFTPPGVNGPVEDQRANVGESLSRVRHLATDGARFA